MRRRNRVALLRHRRMFRWSAAMSCPRAFTRIPERPPACRLITVPECPACNRGWSDDEVHFRTVLLLAGEPNDSVKELWTPKPRRVSPTKMGSAGLKCYERLGRSKLKSRPAHDLSRTDERVIRIIRRLSVASPTITGSRARSILPGSLPMSSVIRCPKISGWREPS